MSFLGFRKPEVRSDLLMLQADIKTFIAVAVLVLSFLSPGQPQQPATQSQSTVFHVSPTDALTQLIAPDVLPAWNAGSQPVMGAFEVFADSSGKITDVRPFPPLAETEMQSLISIAKQLAFHPVVYQGAPVPFVSVLALCTDTDSVTLPCAPKLNANGGVDDAIPQRVRSLMCEDPKSWSKCNPSKPAKTKRSSVMKRISGMNPRYPDEAKHARVTGTVMVRVVVSTAGDVVSFQVLGGPPMLSGSATDAIRTWKFNPLLWKGVPVEVESKVVIHYDLRG